MANDSNTAPSSGTAAQVLDPTLIATSRKNGYIFTLDCGRKAAIPNASTITAYRIYAVPESIGRSGYNGYCENENHRITMDPKGGTNCVEPND